MFRAINALAAGLLLLVGGVGTFITWCVNGPSNWDPNGFTILAGLGVVLLVIDLFVEDRQVTRRTES